MERIHLPPDVLIKIPITDIRHTLDEINKHRHVLAMIKEDRRQRKEYYNILKVIRR